MANTPEITIKILTVFFYCIYPVRSCSNVAFGYPAYSHHDRFPPWWVFVRDDNGGNLSGDKIPPLMMIIINHLTQFNSSRSLVMLLPDCINTALNNQQQRPFLIFLNLILHPLQQLIWKEMRQETVSSANVMWVTGQVDGGED